MLCGKLQQSMFPMWRKYLLSTLRTPKSTSLSQLFRCKSCCGLFMVPGGRERFPFGWNWGLKLKRCVSSLTSSALNHRCLNLDTVERAIHAFGLLKISCSDWPRFRETGQENVKIRPGFLGMRHLTLEVCVAIISRRLFRSADAGGQQLWLGPLLWKQLWNHCK